MKHTCTRFHLCVLWGNVCTFPCTVMGGGHPCSMCELMPLYVRNGLYHTLPYQTIHCWLSFPSNVCSIRSTMTHECVCPAQFPAATKGKHIHTQHHVQIKNNPINHTGTHTLPHKTCAQIDKFLPAKQIQLRLNTKTHTQTFTCKKKPREL